jgi:Tfp pilus assembly protein PilZ
MSLASFGPKGITAPEPPPRTGRAHLAIPVDVRRGGASCAGVTQNVSRDGAFVATPRLHPVGERLTLRLTAPGFSLPLVLQAEVRWLRPVAQGEGDRWPAGIGVQFVDPPLGMRLCLAALLEAHAQP